MANEPTRTEVAAMLGVSPARVSQLAKEIKATVIQTIGQREVKYFNRDVRVMKKRCTKPGPKGSRSGGKSSSREKR